MSTLSSEDSAALEKFGKAYSFKAPKLSSVSEVFHYCSPETINAIVCNKTIRSSDLSKMNDFMELKWGLDIVKSEIDKAKETISDELAVKLIERVDDVIEKSRFLISCFSEDGDILSQWRAYAADGAGFSVGFDAKKLAKKFKHLGPVIYNEELQRVLVRERIISGSSIWHQCSKELKSRITTKIAVILVMTSCYLKNPAFSEEREVRSVIAVFYSGKYDTFDAKIAGQDDLELCFQVRNGLLTPFADTNFSEHSDIVKSIITGPKNNNEDADIKAFFQKNLLVRPDIRKSKASYR